MPTTPPTYRQLTRPAYVPDGRPSSDKRGYHHRWRKQSRAYLARNPLCVVCHEPAECVDHITPLSSGGTYQESNLQAMCRSCHSRKTRRDGGRGG